MAEQETSGWGTGGGRGEGARPSGWDGFGWADGSESPFSAGGTKDRARAVFSRSVHVGRSAWTAPTLGQRVTGVIVLAMVVGLALLILIPAVLIGLVVIAAVIVIATVKRLFRAMSEGATAHGGGRRNVRVVTKGSE